MNKNDSLGKQTKIEFTDEEYGQVFAAARARGMSVNEFIAASIREFVKEKTEIEAHNRRRGLHVAEPENDETA